MAKSKAKIEVTNVKVYPVKQTRKSNIVANVAICFEDAVVVYGKLIEGKNGLFVALPNHSYEDKDGKTVYKDDVYFLDRETADYVTDCVVEEYNKK